MMQLLEAARGAAERRSASLRLTAPPVGWAPPRLPGALVEYVPLDLRGAGAAWAEGWRHVHRQQILATCLLLSAYNTLGGK